MKARVDHMGGEAERKIMIGQGSAEDYAYSIVKLVSHGVNRIRLRAVGENICKLVDTISMLPEIYPGRVRVVGWSIGNRKVRGERRSTLEVDIVLEGSG